MSYTLIWYDSHCNIGRELLWIIWISLEKQFKKIRNANSKYETQTIQIIVTPLLLRTRLASVNIYPGVYGIVDRDGFEIIHGLKKKLGATESPFLLYSVWQNLRKKIHSNAIMCKWKKYMHFIFLYLRCMFFNVLG